jgi:hypothetical protein
MDNILWRFRCLIGVLAVALWMAPLALAQNTSGTGAVSAAVIPQTVEDLLHQMSDRADVIFAGEVIAIRPHEAGATGSGFVEVDFRVDQAIRGCTAGGRYVLREWAGLWTDDAHRYEVGRRLLMLLHAPGASGMSSPVDGMDGAIPIRGGGAASLLSTVSTVSSPAVADLRWLGAKLLHPANYTLQSVLPATPLTVAQQMASMAGLKPPDELIAGSMTGVIDSQEINGRGSVPVQQASVDTVVRLLSRWQKAPHDDVR